MEESKKIYFHKGDVVAFKGIEAESQKEDGPMYFEMKVKNIVWETNEDGTLKYVNHKMSDGSLRKKKQLEGVVVYWINEKGDYVEKMFDTRELYLVERTTKYHLQEAKKALYRENLSHLVEEVNNLLNLV